MGVAGNLGAIIHPHANACLSVCPAKIPKILARFAVRRPVFPVCGATAATRLGASFFPVTTAGPRVTWFDVRTETAKDV